MDILVPVADRSPVWPFSPDRADQQGVSAHRTTAHWIVSFLFYAPLCGTVVGENLMSISEILKLANLAPITLRSNITEIT